MMQGKRIIGLNWKKTDAPTVGVWIRKMAQCMAKERITYIVYQKTNWKYMRKSGTHLTNLLKRQIEGSFFERKMLDKIIYSIFSRVTIAFVYLLMLVRLGGF